MSRVTERITFMLVGAFIAFSAYFIGNFDNTTQAQQDDFVTCDNLLVKESIVVGDLRNFHVTITAKEDSASIGINHHKKGFCGRFLISAAGNSSSFMMSHAEGYDMKNDHVNSVAWIETGESEVVKVLLVDKDGRNLLTTKHPKPMK